MPPDARPTLEQQIEAVELAAYRALKVRWKTKGKREQFVARLEAAAETLRTLEFGRAVLR